MPKLVARMPVKRIEQLSPGLHCVGRQLYAAIGASGSRSWVFRYMSGGMKKDHGIGSMSDVSRDDAERKVEQLREGLRRGVDPIAAKRENAISRVLSTTFEKAARQYYRDNEAGWSASHKRAWLANLENHAFPHIGGLAVDKIGVEDVLMVIKPLWVERHETGSRLRGAIEKILDQARALKQRHGENPAQWRGNLESILPAPKRVKVKAHHDAMDFADVPGFVTQLGERDDDASRALELLILTAARSGEVRDMAWAEVDLQARIWTIPAARMKARREHSIPLSARAIEILASLERKGPDVFDIGRDALAALMPEGSTVHGMRAAFSTWAGERTTFARDIIERCLAHVTGSAVEQSYRRGKEIERKRTVMAEWAQYVASDNKRKVVDFKAA